MQEAVQDLRQAFWNALCPMLQPIAKFLDRLVKAATRKKGGHDD